MVILGGRGFWAGALERDRSFRAGLLGKGADITLHIGDVGVHMSRKGASKPLKLHEKQGKCSMW